MKTRRYTSVPALLRLVNQDMRDGKMVREKADDREVVFETREVRRIINLHGVQRAVEKGGPKNPIRDVLVSFLDPEKRRGLLVQMSRDENALAGVMAGGWEIEVIPSRFEREDLI